MKKIIIVLIFLCIFSGVAIAGWNGKGWNGPWSGQEWSGKQAGGTWEWNDATSMDWNDSTTIDLN